MCLPLPFATQDTSNLGRIDVSSLSQETLIELVIEKITNKQEIIGVIPSHSLYLYFQMLVPVSIISADTSLGKIDKSSFSQQTLMELLIAGFGDTDVFRNSDGSYLDISVWPKMLFEDGDVTVINWTYEFYGITQHPMEPGGSIDLQWIPETVKFFNIADLQLIGSVATKQLPRGLQSLYVSANYLFGTFSVEDLPRGLSRIQIQQNRLSGSLDMTRLPPDLLYFNASENSFSGTINLTKLPAKLTTLLLDQNSLEGSINLEHLPEKISSVLLYSNQFRQDEIRIRSTPRGLANLMVQNGSFSRIVDENGENRKYTEKKMFVGLLF